MRCRQTDNIQQNSVFIQKLYVFISKRKLLPSGNIFCISCFRARPTSGQVLLTALRLSNFQLSKLTGKYYGSSTRTNVDSFQVVSSSFKILEWTRQSILSLIISVEVFVGVQPGIPRCIPKYVQILLHIYTSFDIFVVR